MVLFGSHYFKNCSLESFFQIDDPGLFWTAFLKMVCLCWMEMCPRVLPGSPVCTMGRCCVSLALDHWPAWCWLLSEWQHRVVVSQHCSWCRAADKSRDVRHQRRVEPLVDDPTVVPELPVEWMGWVTVHIFLCYFFWTDQSLSYQCCLAVYAMFVKSGYTERLLKPSTNSSLWL